MQGSDQALYHPACHKQRFHGKCAVCHDYLPMQVHPATAA